MVRHVCFVSSVLLSLSSAWAQDRGTLAIDMEAGRHAFSVYGEADAVRMCGTSDCEPVASFSSCMAVAYSSAASGRAVWAWMEAANEGAATQGAMEECSTAGGPACGVVSVSCLDAQAVEEALELERVTRRRIQEGLETAGFTPGAPDGIFGPATRGAIRRWQASRGARATGYLNRVEVQALGSGASPVAVPRSAGSRIATGEDAPVATEAAQPKNSPSATVESHDAEDVGGGGLRRRPGEVFRDCDACPEMVVMEGGQFALGRYEVTMGEYRAFTTSTGGEERGRQYCLVHPNAFFRLTDRHPALCVSWNRAQEYVSWLSGMTGSTYRLPTEEEWEQASAGAPAGCYGRPGSDGPVVADRGPCPVGTHGSNAAGLSDMLGNVEEWTEDCWNGDCSIRVVRGDRWYSEMPPRPDYRQGRWANSRNDQRGFRVARTLGHRE